jgi:hypothetical protein
MDLNLKEKLLSITCDNASNNESLVAYVDDRVTKYYQKNIISKKRFDGKDSFVHCFSHILNIIEKGILNELKAGIKYDDEKIIDNIDEKQSISTISVIQKIRTLALYIQDSPQRKKI